MGLAMQLYKQPPDGEPSTLWEIGTGPLSAPYLTQALEVRFGSLADMLGRMKKRPLYP